MGFWSWLTGHDEKEADVYANFDKVATVVDEFHSIAANKVPTAETNIMSAIEKLNSTKGFAEFIGPVPTEGFTEMFDSITLSIDSLGSMVSDKADAVKTYNEALQNDPLGVFGSSLCMALANVGEGIASVGEDLVDGVASVVGFVGGIFGAKDFQNDVASFVEKNHVHEFFDSVYYSTDFAKKSLFTEDSAIAGAFKIAGKTVGYLYAGGMIGGIIKGAIGAGSASVLGLSASTSTWGAASAGLIGGIGSGTESGLQSGMSFNEAFGNGLKTGVIQGGMAFAGGKLNEYKQASQIYGRGSEALSNSSDFQGYTDFISQAGSDFGEQAYYTTSSGMKALTSTVKASPIGSFGMNPLEKANALNAASTARETFVQNAKTLVTKSNPIAQTANGIGSALSGAKSSITSAVSNFKNGLSRGGTNALSTSSETALATVGEKALVPVGETALTSSGEVLVSSSASKTASLLATGAGKLASSGSSSLLGTVASVAGVAGGSAINTTKITDAIKTSGNDTVIKKAVDRNAGANLVTGNFVNDSSSGYGGSSGGSSVNGSNITRGNTGGNTSIGDGGNNIANNGGKTLTRGVEDASEKASGDTKTNPSVPSTNPPALDKGVSNNGGSTSGGSKKGSNTGGNTGRNTGGNSGGNSGGYSGGNSGGGSYPSYNYPSYTYPSYTYPSYTYPSYTYPSYTYPAYTSYPSYTYPTYTSPVYSRITYTTSPSGGGGGGSSIKIPTYSVSTSNYDPYQAAASGTGSLSHTGLGYDSNGYSSLGDTLIGSDSLQELSDIDDGLLTSSSLDEVIKNSKLKSIPSSTKPVSSTSSASSLIPMLAGISAASAAGIGAKAYLDRDKGTDEDDDEQYVDDDFNTDDWTGDDDTLDLEPEDGTEYAKAYEAALNRENYFNPDDDYSLLADQELLED